MGSKLSKAAHLIIEGRYKEFLHKTSDKLLGKNALRLLHEGEYKKLLQEIAYNLWGRRLLFMKIKHDKRFYIRDEVLNSVLSDKPQGYELCTLKLGDIHRYWQGKVYSLYDVSPYAYVSRGDTKRYIEYVNKHYDRGSHLEGESRGQMIQRFINKFDGTIASIKCSGYDVHKGIIVVDELQHVWDGQHRSCVLLHLFGPEYEVQVLKIYR